MPDALAIERLSKCYRSISARHWALQAVDLLIASGSTVAIVGPNGAGKSTLFRCVLGLLEPTAGTISIFGRPSSEPESRARVGFFSETASLPRHLTGREALRLFAKLSRIAAPEVEAVIDARTRALRMREFIDRRVSTYSRGMKSRLGLAQASIAEPDLLLLDEPSAGLDPEGRRLVLDVLLARRDAGRATVFATHILTDVETVADRVVFLVSGRVAFDGPMSAFARRGMACTRLERPESPALNGQPSGNDEPLAVRTRRGTTVSWSVPDDVAHASLGLEADQPASNRVPVSWPSLEEAYLEAMRGHDDA